MDFTFPQKVKIGMGVSQQLGVAAREVGTRALVLGEPVSTGSREALVVTQILERAGVKFFLFELLDGQDPRAYMKEAARLAKAGFAEMVVSLGGSRLLSLGRKIAMDLSLPLFELPTTPVVPFLLRNEGWIGTGKPAEWELFTTPPVPAPVIYLDPYLATGTPAIPSMAAYAEMILLGLEASTWDGCDPLTKTLLQGVLSLWSQARAVRENPGRAEERLGGFYSGLALAQMLAQVPRGPVWSLLTLLQGITKIPQGSGAAVLLPAFVEQFLHRRPGLVPLVARGLGVQDCTDDASGAETLGRALRQDLKDFGLALRFQELGLLEAELTLAADMVKAMEIRKGHFLDSEHLGSFLQGVY